MKKDNIMHIPQFQVLHFRYINQNDVDPTPSDEDAEESFSEKQQTSDPLGMEHRCVWI